MAGIKLIVTPLFRQQLVVCAALDDTAVLQHHDAVCFFNGGEPVRDHKAGAALHQPVHTGLHKLFGAGVDGGSGFIQNQHRRVSYGRARNRQQLALALAEVGAVAGQHRIVTVRQAADEAVCVGKLCRGDTLFIRGIQPAVTQQIQSLEKELNVKLFHRTTRTVKITPEGIAFLQDARRIVSIADHAKKQFEDPALQQIQTLFIGCANYAHLFLLSGVLKELSAHYVHLHPHLRVVPFAHLFKLLEENDVDAVIGFREPENNKIRALYQEMIKSQILCICPKDHPLAARKAVTLADMANEKLVLCNPMKTQTDTARLQAKLAGQKTAADIFFCESAEAMTVLVRAGFGVAMLPDLLIPPDANLAAVPIAGTPPASFGVYYKSLAGNRVLKSFIRTLKTHTAQARSKNPSYSDNEHR